MMLNSDLRDRFVYSTSLMKVSFSRTPLGVKIDSKVRFLVSDTGFSGRISVFWRAGKIFSCQHLDLNLS